MKRSSTAALFLGFTASVLVACAAAPVTNRVKPGGPLGKVRSGMSFAQVVQLLGPPTSQSRRVTAQAFNPFHIGGEGQVTEFHYAKRGRVYFTGPDLEGGAAQVIAVEDDPAEPGK